MKMIQVRSLDDLRDEFDLYSDSAEITQLLAEGQEMCALVDRKHFKHKNYVAYTLGEAAVQIEGLHQLSEMLLDMVEMLAIENQMLEAASCQKH